MNYKHELIAGVILIAMGLIGLHFKVDYSTVVLVFGLIMVL